jgi:serine O-acetyltransferase
LPATLAAKGIGAANAAAARDRALSSRRVDPRREFLVALHGCAGAQSRGLSRSLGGAIVARMSDRSRRDEPPPGASFETPRALSPEVQAELDRYFRDTEEGRAELARFFRESPDGQACMQEHFSATPQRRAELEQHFKHAPDGIARLQDHLRHTPGGDAELRASIVQEVRREQPAFLAAVRADAAVYESLMLTPLRIRTGIDLLRQVLRLAWQSDAFCCQILYRMRVSCFVRGVPILPTILHRLCVMMSQIDIGNNVLLEPGVYIPHGKVVIDGIVRIGAGTMITPWVTLGLTTTIAGPSVGRDCMIGTGAKILGPVQIGDRARIAANAVVVSDVPAHTTVAGAPAKIVRDRRSDGELDPASH